MIVFDFFSGTGSSTRAFEDAGDTVISFELDKRFGATVHADVATLHAPELIDEFGRPDFVWASPPCTAFSVASIGHHWHANGDPKTKEAEQAIDLVISTKSLVRGLGATAGFVIENPRGMLRRMPFMRDLLMNTVTYCQYGDSRMKPTDLWTNLFMWMPRPACKNGDKCHESAPRGSRTGTQGRNGPIERAMVPYELGAEIRESLLPYVR